MNKQLFPFLLIMLMSMVGTKAFAHDIEVPNSDGVTIYYVWTNNNTELAICYKGSWYGSYTNEYSGNIVIPSSVEYSGKTYSVTSISPNAFYNCSGLTSVTIPNSVTNIGRSAFCECSALTSVTIPNSVTSIGDGAFWRCRALTSVTIPNSVTSIEYDTFYGCSSLTSIEIPNNVTSIGENAFGDCSSLTSLIIGSGVTSIGNAFNGTNLKKTIWLTNTPPSGFRNASGVINYVSNDNLSLSNRIKYQFLSSYFDVDGIRYVPVSPSERTCDAIDCVYNESATNTKISSTVVYKDVTMNVKNIKDYLAYNNKYMKTLTIDCEGELADYSFTFCTNLTNVTLGHNVSSIGQNAFQGCTNLQTIEIPNSVKAISTNAFGSCGAMTSVKIGSGVEIINNYTFSDCSSLKEIKIGSNVKTIDQYAFSGCSALPSITIPQAVTDIKNSVFNNCTSLKIVIIADSESDLNLGSTQNNKPLFFSCPLDTVYIGRNINYKTSPSYGYSPFYRNTSLRAVKITDKENEISENEFYGCTNLQRVIIGDGVTTIGNWAFSDCQSLKFFTFGTHVANIGKEAFSDCSSVVEITSKALIPPICGSQALDDINKWNCVLYVPNGCMDVYKAADQWKDFIFIKDSTGEIIHDFETESIHYKIGENNTVTVISKEEKYSGEIVIPSKVEFNGITYTVTSIGESAFEGCSDVTSVTIPSSVTTIESGAFYKCSGLTSVNIPEGVTEIGLGAFSGCKSMTSVTIPSTVTAIDKYAFDKCTSLSRIVSEIQQPFAIDKTVFETYDDPYNVYSMATLVVPDGSKSAYQAAAGWSNFKNIVQPHEVYKLTYYVDGEEYKSVNYEYGEEIIPEADPTKEGYTFSGWGEIPQTMPDHDVTISGTFNINMYKLIYVVDGVEYKTYDIEYGSTITPEAEPIKEGYIFSGWSEIPEKMPAHDVTVTGNFAINDKELIFNVDGIYYKTGEKNTVSVISNESKYSGDVVIPSHVEYDGVIYSVTSISDSAFDGCSELTSISLPSSLKIIESGAFYKCSGLTSVNIPEGVTEIGLGAFSGCKSMTSVTIPSTVTAIDKYAFDKCTSLSRIVSEIQQPFAIDKTVFETYDDPYNVYSMAILVVPDGSKSAYQSTAGWSNFKNIVQPHEVYKLTYYVDGEEYKSVNYEYGEEIIPEQEPAKEGYTFSGWSEIPETMPATDITIVGTFVFNQYTITYMIDGEKFTTETVDFNSKITPPIPPSKDGFDFAWDEYPDTMPAHDITINGSYTTGISTIEFESGKAKIFTLDGRQVDTPQKGVNIIRMNDGTIKKIVIK